MPGWDSTVAAVVAKQGGHGVGRAHAVAICFGILQVLSVLHAGRMVHSRVTPETAVRLVGGGTWSLVEFHTVLPFGADFGAARLKAGDPVYCAPELHHGQGRGVTVATPAWDMWGVGALLVLLLTGKRIAAQSSMEVLGKTDTIADMAQYFKDLPQDPVLLDLVWQLVRYHPRQRIQAAEALRHPAFVAFGFALSAAVDGSLGLGPSFTAAPDLSRTMPIDIPEEDSDTWSDSPAQLTLADREGSDQESADVHRSELPLGDGEQLPHDVSVEAITDAAPSGDDMGTTSEEYSTYSSSEDDSDTSSSSSESDDGDEEDSSADAKPTPELQPEQEPELVPEPEREENTAAQLGKTGKSFMKQEKSSFNVFERKKRVLCATHIQRIARGHLAREVVRAIHGEIRSAAAVAIQAAARGCESYPQPSWSAWAVVCRIVADCSDFNCKCFYSENGERCLTAFASGLTRRSPSAAMVSAVTAAAKSGIMVESPTQLPQAFSAAAPPPPGSPSTPGSPEQLDLHHPSPSCGKNAIERPAWVKIIDRNTQRPYYWNRITEEVQWDAPIVEENVSERDRRIAAKTRYCKSERAKQVFLFV